MGLRLVAGVGAFYFTQAYVFLPHLMLEIFNFDANIQMSCFHLMQFKFFVDGEWRHDEHQPFESGNYGFVNTILAREPGMTNFTPETGRSNMDVDNDVFMRAVRIFFQYNYQLVFFFVKLSLFVIVASLYNDYCPE